MLTRLKSEDKLSDQQYKHSYPTTEVVPHMYCTRCACECVYKIPCKNCDKTYIGETSRAFGLRLQEHRQEVTQRDVWRHNLNSKHQ